MKRCRLSYDEWKCIVSKELFGKRIESDVLKGYVGLIEIHEVSEPQIWKFNGEDIVVCDKGIKWVSVLPEDDWYCITAMLNEKEEIILWYIDMIAGQGVDGDGVPYFDDLYLDLVVYPDGTVIVDDRDELEEAFEKNIITQVQYRLALETCDKLREGLLKDIALFKEFTYQCYEEVGNTLTMEGKVYEQNICTDAGNV